MNTGRRDGRDSRFATRMRNLRRSFLWCRNGRQKFSSQGKMGGCTRIATGFSGSGIDTAGLVLRIGGGTGRRAFALGTGAGGATVTGAGPDTGFRFRAADTGVAAIETRGRKGGGVVTGILATEIVPAMRAGRKPSWPASGRYCRRNLVFVA